MYRSEPKRFCPRCNCLTVELKSSDNLFYLECPTCGQATSKYKFVIYADAEWDQMSKLYLERKRGENG